MSLILVVEDDEMVASVICSMLGQGGYDTFLAKSGEEAWDYLQKSQPALILSDIMMPGMGGFGLLNLIRANPALAMIPVIFLSALDKVYTHRMAMNLGVDDFLSKPINKDHLFKAISSRLERRQSYDTHYTAQLKGASDFLSLIAHDLRGPMTRIRLALAELEMMNEEKSLDSIDHIDQSVDFMAGMVERLVLMARYQNGNIPFTPKPINPMELCYRARAFALAESSPQHEVKVLGTHVEPLYLDSILIVQILTNLLTNAIKYSPQGGDVTLECTLVEGRLVFVVTDQGLGMAPEEVTQLFDRFTRSRRTDMIPGIGLGLPAVKTFVEVHRGQILCESTPHVGTRMTVDLPAWRSESELPLQEKLSVCTRSA